MISEAELLNSIAECKAAPATYQNCERLAVFYTLYDRLYAHKNVNESLDGYNNALPLNENKTAAGTVSVPHTNSVFFKLVDGMDLGRFWEVIDELVSTVEVINPKLYEGVVKRLKNT